MGATDYKQISIWIDKHVQKEQVKKLLGVEFIVTPKRSAVSDYIVGGSSVASSVFMAITTGELSVKAFTYGLALAIIGKYLKEEKKV